MQAVGPELELVRRHPLPMTVRERILQMRVSFSMGAFADARLAFAAVDNSMFLWPLDADVDSPQTSLDEALIYYETMQEVIIAAGCVPPRAGTCCFGFM